MEATPLRRSTRVRNPPTWMKDFIGSVDTTFLPAVASGTTPHTFPYLVNHSLHTSYVDYLLNISVEREPFTFKEASSHPKWVEAMEAELQALDNNCTWEIVDLPSQQETYRLQMGL